MKTLTNFLNKGLEFFVPNRYAKLGRYIMSGGTAAAVDIGFLFIFTSVFHIWYLLSAILAFLIAFCVSFVLQKFWTFDDHGIEKWKSQAVGYFVIAGVNLGINTMLMYIFVDIFGIQYIAAQFVAGALVAFESYFLYQKLIFKKHE